jgi:hypothetical protein
MCFLCLRPHVSARLFSALPSAGLLRWHNSNSAASRLRLVGAVFHSRKSFSSCARSGSRCLVGLGLKNRHLLDAHVVSRASVPRASFRKCCSSPAPPSRSCSFPQPARDHVRVRTLVEVGEELDAQSRPFRRPYLPVLNNRQLRHELLVPTGVVGPHGLLY